jgi:hypothetical protein
MSGTEDTRAWGVSVTGLLLYHGLSPEGVDPFYPVVYADVGNVFEKDAAEVDVDTCFSDTTSDGFMHYHSASSCIADKAGYENGGSYNGYVIN